MTSRHLFKLAVKKRQTSIRPPIDQICDLIARSRWFGCRRAPIERFSLWHACCFLQKFDKRRHSVLDSEMLFYLQSRGIGKVDARNLLIYAFAQDIVDRIKEAALRDSLERILFEKFHEHAH